MLLDGRLAPGCDDDIQGISKNKKSNAAAVAPWCAQGDDRGALLKILLVVGRSQPTPPVYMCPSPHGSSEGRVSSNRRGECCVRGQKSATLSIGREMGRARHVVRTAAPRLPRGGLRLAAGVRELPRQRCM